MKVLGILELDVNLDMIRKPPCQQLILLKWLQTASMCQSCLERRHVGVDVVGEGEPGEVRQMISRQSEPKAPVAEKAEGVP